METREIASAQWTEFFERFTREHDGAPATLRVLGGELGAQVEARELPFEGISPDRRGGDPITIDLGRGLGTHIEHRVTAPKRVWAQVDENGRDIALEIESADNTKTIIDFSPAGA
jgi:hypothetical protein